MSRVEIQLTTEATHILESNDRCHEQDPNVVHHKSHSLPEEPRTGIVSRVKIKLTMEATHFLKSQGVTLARRERDVRGDRRLWSQLSGLDWRL